jgi:FlaA1/EpsC-like NDP-sugar epimerase
MSLESKLARRYRAQRLLHRSIGFSLDLAAFVLSALLAFELRFDGALPAQYFRPMWMALCIWAVAKSACFFVGAVNRESWRHTSVHDAERIFLAVLAGSILGGLVIFHVVGQWGIPRSVYILDWLISCLLTMGGRLAVRVVATASSRSRVEGDRKRTLIYGAGDAGITAEPHPYVRCHRLYR